MLLRGAAPTLAASSSASVSVACGPSRHATYCARGRGRVQSLRERSAAGRRAEESGGGGPGRPEGNGEGAVAFRASYGTRFIPSRVHVTTAQSAMLRVGRKVAAAGGVRARERRRRSRAAASGGGREERGCAGGGVRPRACRGRYARGAARGAPSGSRTGPRRCLQNSPGPPDATTGLKPPFVWAINRLTNSTKDNQPRGTAERSGRRGRRAVDPAAEVLDFCAEVLHLLGGGAGGIRHLCGWAARFGRLLSGAAPVRACGVRG